MAGLRRMLMTSTAMYVLTESAWVASMTNLWLISTETQRRRLPRLASGSVIQR